MSSKESQGKGDYTNAQLSDPKNSNIDEGEAKRPSRRSFDQNSSRPSSSNSASDMETDDDAPTVGSQIKKRSMEIRSSLYTPNHEKNKLGSSSNMSDDNPPDHGREKQSHLFNLVRKKKAMNKYANKLVNNNNNQDKTRTSGKSVDVSSEKVTTEATTYDATSVKVEEGRMKSAGSRATISSYDGSKSSIDTANLTDEQKEEAKKVSKGILLLQESIEKGYAHLIYKFPIEIRMKNLCFSVPYTEASTKKSTVYNSSFVYKAIKLLKRLTNGATETKHTKVSYTKHVLDNISLSLKPGKM